MTEIFGEMILYLQDVLWFLTTDKYQKCFQKWSVAFSWYRSQLRCSSFMGNFDISAELKIFFYFFFYLLQIARKWVCL